MHEGSSSSSQVNATSVISTDAIVSVTSQARQSCGNLIAAIIRPLR